MEKKTIHGYTIIKLIGKGGMAKVWYGENGLGKPAAIKIMHKQYAEDDSIKSAFFKRGTSHDDVKKPHIYVMSMIMEK